MIQKSDLNPSNSTEMMILDSLGPEKPEHVIYFDS